MRSWLGTGVVRKSSTVAAVSSVLLLAASGVAVSGPTSSGDRNTYVPIRACQLMDTRPAPHTVGPRHTPLAAGQTITVTVRGAQGKCSVAANATAAMLTVTAMGPSGKGGLKVFPADQTPPVNALLRWTANQAPAATEGAVRLSADGKIKLTNASTGTVDVLLDVNGYFQPHNHDDRYYTKAAADSRFFDGSTLILVRADGAAAANGTALRNAVTAITDASAAKPYSVRLAPGTYDVGVAGLDVPAFVDLEGSGQRRSVLTAPGSPDLDAFDGGVYGTLRLAGDSALRDVTVENTGGASTIAVGVGIGSGEVTLSDVAIDVSGGSGASVANLGIAASLPDTGTPQLSLEGSDVRVNAGGAIGELGNLNGFSSIDVRDSRLTTTGGGFGLGADATELPTNGLRVSDSEISVSGGGVGVASSVDVSDDYLLDGVRITVSGGANALGVGSSGGGFHPDIRNSTITVSGATTSNKGYDCNLFCSLRMQNSHMTVTGTGSVAMELGQGTTDSGTAFVDGSVVQATTIVSSINAATQVSIGASQLSASTIISGAGTFVCIASYKANYTAVSSTCT